MSNYHPEFFYSHSTWTIPKKPDPKEVDYERLKLLIIVMLMLYLSHFRTMISQSQSFKGHEHIIEYMPILCCGMLVFIRLVIMLIYIAKLDCNPVGHMQYQQGNIANRDCIEEKHSECSA